MEESKSNPKPELKFCPNCNRVVKAVLLRKGRYYHEYLCLEQEESDKLHVFKVKSKFMANIQMAEEGALKVGPMLMLGTMVKGASASIPQIPTEETGEVINITTENIMDNAGDVNWQFILPDGGSVDVSQFAELFGMDVSSVLEILSELAS